MSPGPKTSPLNRTYRRRDQAGCGFAFLLAAVLGLSACQRPAPPTAETRIPPGLESRFYPPPGWTWARLDVADASLANHAGTLHAVYGLVERCKAIGAGQGGLNLVLAGDLGDLQTAVWSTSDLDVMDAVCQAATVHPCDETRAASLRRSQLLDRLLVRSGQLPVLLELSEEEALIRGNELMRLLDVQFGRERALALLDGKESQLEARVAAGVIAALSGNGDAADRDGRPALAPPVREAISLEPSTESDE